MGRYFYLRKKYGCLTVFVLKIHHCHIHSLDNNYQTVEKSALKGLTISLILDLINKCSVLKSLFSWFEILDVSSLSDLFLCIISYSPSHMRNKTFHACCVCRSFPHTIFTFAVQRTKIPL